MKNGNRKREIFGNKSLQLIGIPAPFGHSQNNFYRFEGENKVA